jgi:hypothetical protein
MGYRCRECGYGPLPPRHCECCGAQASMSEDPCPDCAALRARLAEAERKNRRWEEASRAACSCGGGGPDDDVCPACHMWHAVNTAREE